MTEGTLIEWKKKVGDRVTKGEIIAEVDTDKAAIEIESFHTGIIERLLTKPGDRVAVGSVMAVIREEGEARRQVEAKVKAEEDQKVRTPAEGERVRISPAARKLAADLGVHLSTVHGTGPDGAITLDDIEHTARAAGYGREAGRAETPPPIALRPSPLAPAAVAAADKQARMRQTIAAAMARSKREIPHYYLSATIDMGPATAWLAAENTKRPVTDRLLLGVLLLEPISKSLR
jgi:pyruvate dehydrogenase E2 component (dihydrolipoamide acetyltransferase)